MNRWMFYSVVALCIAAVTIVIMILSFKANPGQFK